MKQAVSVIAVALLIASGAYPSNLSAQEPTRSPSRFVPRVSLAGAFDARNNVPRIGRILIARGRDATDVALSSTFGRNTLTSFRVWTDEVREP